METMMQDVQTAPEQIIVQETGECLTCASGADPAVANDLFQAALRDAL